MAHTLLEAALIGQSKRNAVICNDLSKISGLLSTGIASPASNGVQDVDLKNLALGVGAFRIPNAGVTPTAPTYGSVVTDLFPYSYEDKIDRFLLRKANKSIKEWLNHISPSIREGTAQAIASQLYYGTAISANGFKGLRQIALEYGNNFDAYSSGAGSDYTSIMVVHWHTREACILYDPDEMRGLGKDQLMKLFVKNGGAMTTLYDANGLPYTGYEYGGEIALGLKIMSEARVSILMGVKDATNYTPTKDDIRLLVEAVKGSSDGSTFIYANSTGRRLLSGLLDSANVFIQVAAKMGNLPLMVGSFDQIPVMLEEGITSTEARTT